MTVGTRAARSDRLLASARPVWDAILTHPFLRELRDGSLPIATFRFYLEQDWLYIQERIGEWAIDWLSSPTPRHFLAAVVIDPEADATTGHAAAGHPIRHPGLFSQKRVFGVDHARIAP